MRTISQTPTITGETVLKKGKFLGLKQLHLTHPNGRQSSYEVVSRHAEKVFGIVTVLPITTEGEIVMIRQYRAPINQVGIEFPSGCAETGKHSDLEQAVHDELREETGYVAESLQYL